MTTWKTLVLALGLGLTLTACGGTRPEVNEQTDQWVDNLILKLCDECPSTRLEAAIALSIAGPKAAKAIPALECALEDSDCNVRCAVHRALVRMGAEPRPLASTARTEQVRHD